MPTLILVVKLCSCVSLIIHQINNLFQETSHPGVPLQSYPAGHRPEQWSGKFIWIFSNYSSFYHAVTPQNIHWHWPVLSRPVVVRRLVHSAGLWLLRHHQGHRPQESHRPDQTARLHWGDSRKHRPQRTLLAAVSSFNQFNRGLGCDSVCVSSWCSCRSTLFQRTGCTKRPGVCFWSPRWWTAPRWSWSGANQTRRGWSSSCATRNSSGEAHSKMCWWNFCTSEDLSPWCRSHVLTFKQTLLTKQFLLWLNKTSMI